MFAAAPSLCNLQGDLPDTSNIHSGVKFPTPGIPGVCKKSELSPCALVTPSPATIQGQKSAIAFRQRMRVPSFLHLQPKHLHFFPSAFGVFSQKVCSNYAGVVKITVSLWGSGTCQLHLVSHLGDKPLFGSLNINYFVDNTYLHSCFVLFVLYF